MSLESESDAEQRIAKTIEDYKLTVEEILASDLNQFIEDINSENDLVRLDKMKRALAWVINEYVPKKDKESIAYRRTVGSYLSPLRTKINAIKPQGIPPTDQRLLTNLKRNTS